MKISIITLFPQMFSGPFDFSIVKRAVDKKLIEINLVNLRDFGIGKHKTVDDKVYGGGRGMIIRVDVLEKAVLETLDKSLSKDQQRVVFLGPKGKSFDQKKATEFVSLKHLILICGHYEDIDHRAYQFIDEEISVGDFITTGGEIPAMLMTDAITRLIKGVLPQGVTEDESFASGALEHPQYTRPQSFKDLSVPKTLLSGHHKNVQDWKKQQSKNVTQALRPDLIKED